MLNSFSSCTTADEDLPLRSLRTPAVLREHRLRQLRPRVAYLPDLQLVGSLERDDSGTWRSPLPRADASGYRLCRNYKSKTCATGRCRQTTRARCARRAA